MTKAKVIKDTLEPGKQYTGFAYTAGEANKPDHAITLEETNRVRIGRLEDSIHKIYLRQLVSILCIGMLGILIILMKVMG